MSEQLPSERKLVRERITLYVDELTYRDSYGVHGSDFFVCKICYAESGAGVLNKGIKHKDDCPLGRHVKRKEKKNGR
jgi:hypothetical protein